MEEAASIIIHLDCYDAIKCLPDELAGVLFQIHTLLWSQWGVTKDR